MNKTLYAVTKIYTIDKLWRNKICQECEVFYRRNLNHKYGYIEPCIRLSLCYDLSVISRLNNFAPTEGGPWGLEILFVMLPIQEIIIGSSSDNISYNLILLADL